MPTKLIYKDMQIESDDKEFHICINNDNETYLKISSDGEGSLDMWITKESLIELREFLKDD